MNKSRYLISICAGALLFAATAVSAQAIYRQTDAAGKITYTDRPDGTLPGGAQMIAQLDVPIVPSLISEPPPAQVRRSIISSRRAAAIDADEAQRRLAQARLRREQGASPMPGEKVQAAGNVTLTDRYWRRQEELRRGVELALKRSNETQQKLLLSSR